MPAPCCALFCRDHIIFIHSRLNEDVSLLYGVHTFILRSVTQILLIVSVMSGPQVAGVFSHVYSSISTNVFTTSVVLGKTKLL